MDKIAKQSHFAPDSDNYDSRREEREVIGDPLFDEFSTFDKRIQPSYSQERIAADRASRLSRALRNNSNISECHIVGSFARSTAIRIFSDLDILATFNIEPGTAIEDSRSLLDMAASAVSGLSQAVTRIDNTVSLSFVNWPDVDIIPAIASSLPSELGSMRIPAHSGGWQLYSPQADDQLVERAVSTLGARFTSLVRIFKWWSKLNGDAVRSFEIEKLAYETFTEGIPPYPQAIHMLFSSAMQAEFNRSRIHSQVGVPDNVGRRNYDVLAQADALVMQAEETAISNIRQAGVLWRRLLGEFFPVVAG